MISLVSVYSVAKDVYFDKQAAEADRKKEDASRKHPKQSIVCFTLAPKCCVYMCALYIVIIYCTCTCMHGKAIIYNFSKVL